MIYKQKKKVIALSGSVRKDSSNLHIIKAIANLAAESLDIEMYDKLEELPYFNPDRDKDRVPEAVEAFRNKLIEADGVLICTPEYVFSLPGVLKNAIEWLVSTTILSEKPVALITASGLGEKAHQSLRLIIKTLYAKTPENAQLLIQGARTKVNSSGVITDPATLQKVKQLISSFSDMLYY